MKITVTTDSTSLYDLLIAWLQANHSLTEAQAIALLDQFDNASWMQADIYVASWVVYAERSLPATTTTGMPLGASITRFTLQNFSEMNLIAWGSVDVIVTLWWAF